MTDLPFLFDPGPVAWIQQLLGPGWPGPWRVAALFGSNWGILLVAGLGLWLWGRRVAYALLAVVAVDGILRTAINRVVYVPRPEGGGLVVYEQLDVGSFPSGHTSTAAALWGYLGYRRLLPWAVAIVPPLLVAISRFYLGVHYIGDVLGGILLAVIVVGLVSLIWSPIERWLERRSFGFFLAVAGLVLAGAIAGAFFLYGTNPYQWRAGGLLAGLAIALPLEYRFVRYRPGTQTVAVRVGKVLIGGIGIAACAAVDKLSGEQSFSLGMFVTALAGIWAMLVAPTIFARLGWSEREEPKREKVVRRVARGLGVATAILVLLTGYGVAIEPRLILDVEEHEARIPNLPPAWEGRTVALVSDFQVGLWLDNTGMMRRAAENIADREPSAVLIAGDFLYGAGSRPEVEVRHVLDILRPVLELDVPVLAVLGNHDWGVEQPGDTTRLNREAATLLRDSLESRGVRFLHNRSTALPAGDGDPLYVIGVGSRWANRTAPLEAVDAVPDSAARLVLMHHPQTFPRLPAGSAPLAVAGHTHGGQVRIPLTPQWSWLTFTQDDEVHADGWIEGEYGEPGNRLYVSRGVGMSVIPMRINCPPEVTYFTLRRGPIQG